MLKKEDIQQLESQLEGTIHSDIIHRTIYATDASAYKEMPAAVAFPKTETDIVTLIHFAKKHHTSLIPRAAGTSLAGQVVGKGIVVDISRYMNQIIELNTSESWVKVQPGVILDELNKFLEPHGLFFGPETSTSNRCMIGGMVGNNACGSHSILYGSTRDHLLEVKTILSDGSLASFSSVNKQEFETKCQGESLENNIYKTLHEILSNKFNQLEIINQFPDKELNRRNTGYAIDLLLDSEIFSPDSKKAFNFCKLLAGSEGTLAFITEIKLNLVPLPPKTKAVLAVHLHSLSEALQANLIALNYKPGAVELMDKTILDLTRDNIEQQKNRFFLQGDPEAILIIEFARESKEEIESLTQHLIEDLQHHNYGYHFPVIWGKDISRIWNLRKSGLGVLSNMAGDSKPVSLIEDTAVHVSKLPAYIEEFNKIIENYQLQCVYHAHVGSGELHLRPVLNLKSSKDVRTFRALAFDIAKLVKKYRGSLSGEHGDGRLRGEFIPFMIGEHNYTLLKKIKRTWDHDGIFNPGKITDTPPMNSFLRYSPDNAVKEIKTYFDYSNEQGFVRAVEKCNGSGDCRKTEIIGGAMCPSYMATRDEKTSTRARANTLREFVSTSTKKNPFDHKEIMDVLDLCLSCKACKSECPSNVDMAKFKAEFLQHYYDSNGVPFRSWLIANIGKINRIGSWFPDFTNFFLKRKWLKSFLGFSTKRDLPLLSRQSLKKWYKKNYKKELNKLQTVPSRKVFLFVDEFTNYNDTQIGIKAIKLLLQLGYEVEIPNHLESGRTYLSKGLLKKARQIAEKNVQLLSDKISTESQLIGIEPSAILSFRDEYPELVRDELKVSAHKLASNVLLFDEFLMQEKVMERISSEFFTEEKRVIKLHCHCQQKAIATSWSTIEMLSLPKNFEVAEIPSTCCGMAGSFGYEKEHYEISKKIGELILFKTIRKLPSKTLIAAQGTSCRHQIKDGTGRMALHPVEILYDALK